MKGEKGSLKNRIKEWKLRKQYKKRIKNQEKIKARNIKKEIREQEKKNKFIEIQTITEAGKLGLKTVFEILFGFLENININSNKKDNKDKKILKTSTDTLGETITETFTFEETKEIEENENILTGRAIELLPAINNLHENKYIVEVEKDISKDNLDQQIINEEIEEGFILEKVKMITNGINNAWNNLNTIIESNENIKDKRKEIINIKKEVQELKECYCESIAPKKNILNDSSAINQIDLYNIRKNPKEMNRLLQQCDIELSKIKKENKRICQENIEVNNELECIKTVIDEKLKEQKNDIDELKKSFNCAEVQNKRPTLVIGIHNFLSKTMNIGLNLLPITICKNKFVGMLGSIIVLNNRLRNMRKIIRKDNNNINYITYKNIEEEIKNQQLCIGKTKEILEDSLHQLQSLKQEFIMEFYYDMDRYKETEDIMTEFASIEYQITSKNIELEEMLKEEPEKGMAI